MTDHKLYKFYKRFALSFTFYITESIVTAFLLSYYNYLSKPTIEFSNIEIISRFTFAIFIFRIFTLQIITELLMTYLIIYLGKWKNFGLVFLGVVVAVLLWNYSLILISHGNPFEDNELLKAAFGGYGIPLFSGCLFAWWLCYKKIGLKV
jgi:hypothetical protein